MDILSYTLKYLEKKFEQVKINKLAKTPQFWCPVCNELNCQIIPHSGYKLICHKCGQGKNMGTLIDVMKKTFNMSEDDVIEDIKKVLGLTIVTNKEQNAMLDFYKEQNFDMVQIAHNKKIPIEKEWTTKLHTNKEEWSNWLKEGSNIGLKTGKVSNVTVIDIDQNPIPEEIKKYLDKCDTLHQVTNKGHHFVFKYDADLPKSRIFEQDSKTKEVKLAIDIENNGGQIVIAPSTVDNKIREINFKPILQMSKEFKDFLLSKIKVYTPSTRIKENITGSSIDLEKFDLKGIGDGNRHNIFMHLGGILRKNLNLEQTKEVLTLLNRYFANPPLSNKEFHDIVNQLDKYIVFDEKDLAKEIIHYLKQVGESNKTELELAVTGNFTKGEDKTKLGKALNYLIKERFISKSGKVYQLVKKADWKETFAGIGTKITFTMPYFDDCAIFRNGDMIVIGGKTGQGKSHIAINIMKRLIAQNIKPHYITLESGNRWAVISRQLGLVEGQFLWDEHYSPEHIEIEKNAVTIIDWLLPKDYANTDKLFEYFSQQLSRNGGILIIFVQLRDNGEFFAKDMIRFFPAFVTKFFYEEDNNTKSYFQLIKIREKINNFKTEGRKIPTIYNWESKELNRVDELDEYN